MKLPTGTVSFESISEERLLGKVDCEPRIISSGEAERSKRVREDGRRRGGTGREGRRRRRGVGGGGGGEERLLRKVNCETRIINSWETERSKWEREKWSRGRGEGRGREGCVML